MQGRTTHQNPGKLLSILAALSLLLFTSSAIRASDEPVEFGELYRVMLLRAAPGDLPQVLELTTRQSTRTPHTYTFRHSQGAHWDVMVLLHIGSYSQWFSDDNAKHLLIDGMFREHLDKLVSHRSEWFAYGPATDVLAKQQASAGLVHIEMFNARGGYKTKLVRQRMMENNYLRQTNQVANLVFRGDQGSDWDVMTLGFHQSMASFATGSNMTHEQKNSIAKQAGFASVDDIGFYMRSLILSHQDTLAVPVRPPQKTE